MNSSEMQAPTSCNFDESWWMMSPAHTLLVAHKFTAASCSRQDGTRKVKSIQDCQIKSTPKAVHSEDAGLLVCGKCRAADIMKPPQRSNLGCCVVPLKVAARLVEGHAGRLHHNHNHPHHDRISPRRSPRPTAAR